MSPETPSNSFNIQLEVIRRYLPAAPEKHPMSPETPSNSFNIQLEESSEGSHLPAVPKKHAISLPKPFATASTSTESIQLENTSGKPLLLTKSKGREGRKRKARQNGTLAVDLESDVNTDDEVAEAMQDLKQAKQRKSRAKKYSKHQENDVEDVANNIANAIQFVQYAKLKESQIKKIKIADSENRPFSYIAQEHNYALIQSEPSARQKKKGQSRARKPDQNIRNPINETNCFAVEKSAQLSEDNEEKDSADAITTFCCRYCLMEFVHKGYLLQHVQEEHSNVEDESLEIKPEVFQCNKCPSSFIAVEDISKHLQITHGDLIDIPNIKTKANNDKIYENYKEVEDIVTVQQRSENHTNVQITVEVKRETIDSSDDLDIDLNNSPSSQISANDFEMLEDKLVDLNGTGVPDFRINNIRGSYEKSSDCFGNENSLSSSANSILKDTEITSRRQLYVHCAPSHPARKIFIVKCKGCLNQFANEVIALDHMHQAFNTKSHCYSKTELNPDKVPNEVQLAVVLENFRKNLPKKDLENLASKRRNNLSKNGAHADKKFTITREEVFDGDGQNKLLTPLREEDERILVKAYDPSVCKSCLKPHGTKALNETGVPDFCNNDIRGSYEKSRDCFENENCSSSRANSILKDTEITSRRQLYVHCATSHPATKIFKVKCKGCLNEFANEVIALDHMHQAFNTKSHCYSKTELNPDKVPNEVQLAVVLENFKKNLPKKDLENPASKGRNNLSNNGAHADKKFTITREEVFDGHGQNKLLIPLREEDEKILVKAYDPSVCKSCLKPLGTKVGNELKCEKCKAVEAIKPKPKIRISKKILNKKKKSLKCDICGEILQNYLSLRAHAIKTHL